jgi:hypothetical protein
VGTGSVTVRRYGAVLQGWMVIAFSWITAVVVVNIRPVHGGATPAGYLILILVILVVLLPGAAYYSNLRPKVVMSTQALGLPRVELTPCL